MDNVPKKRKSGKRPRKYKFTGNQYTRKSSFGKNMCASAKKLSSSVPIIPDKEFKGYCLVDINLVFNSIQDCVSCNICNGKVTISYETVYGLSAKINVMCESCGEISSTRNSAMLGEKKNKAEINSRFIYAMRALGQGLSGAKTFCGIMDMPSPVTLTAYNSAVSYIQDISSKVAKNSMSSAALEETSLNGGVTDITVSGDGTWKTRGHTSIIGVCTVIGGLSGKVIDTEVLSSHCRGCSSWKDVRAGKQYEDWCKEHSKVCQKNHSGSAAMMEVVGMERIFERSTDIHNVRYSNYIGDGDCKTFSAIQQKQPYGGDFNIQKIECVGHMQKRMGSRLRKRKQEMKGETLSDGKKLSGKGRLTDQIINQLTVYYGNAIRKHSDSVKDMQRAIWAIFYHKRSTDAEPTHNFCPQGFDSWCTYQKAVSNGESNSYKHKNSIAPVIMDTIKGTFKDLSMPLLLKRCLGGRTQNANESLNSVIWKFCPKTSGAGVKIAQIATNEAVITFNDGQNGRLNLMKELGYKVGENSKAFALSSDRRRVLAAERMAEMSTLEARRAKKRLNIAANEALKAKEGTVYSTGQF